MIYANELALNWISLKGLTLNHWISFSKPMQRLILMRHAKTEPWFQGTDDEARALLPRGKSDAELVAQALVSMGWTPDIVLVSSARRTRETWKMMVPLMAGARLVVLDALYLAGTAALEQAITDHEGAGTLMLLGHNPGIHDLAVQVASRAGTVNQPAAKTLAGKMPTGAAALFEAEEEAGFEPSALVLQEFLIAKRLRPDSEMP